MRGEAKDQRFKRVAERRVQNVVDNIRKLSQCANQRMYKWNDDQLHKIWDAIGQELEKCKASFEKAEPDEFKL